MAPWGHTELDFGFGQQPKLSCATGQKLGMSGTAGPCCWCLGWKRLDHCSRPLCSCSCAKETSAAVIHWRLAWTKDISGFSTHLELPSRSCCVSIAQITAGWYGACWIKWHAVWHGWNPVSVKLLLMRHFSWHHTVPRAGWYACWQGLCQHRCAPWAAAWGVVWHQLWVGISRRHW